MSDLVFAVYLVLILIFGWCALSPRPGDLLLRLGRKALRPSRREAPSEMRVEPEADATQGVDGRRTVHITATAADADRRHSVLRRADLLADRLLDLRHRDGAAEGGAFRADSLMGVDFAAAEARILARARERQEAYREQGPEEDTTIGRTDGGGVVVRFALHGPESTPEDMECDLWVDAAEHRLLLASYDEWDRVPAMHNSMGGVSATIADGKEVCAIINTVELPGLRDAIPVLEELQRRDGWARWENMDDATFRFVGGLSCRQREQLFGMLGLVIPEGEPERRRTSRLPRRRNLDLE